MESGTKIRDPDVKPKSFPLLNGDAKKHPHRTTTTTTTEADEILLYRECMKNHAASLGGHALDGCGEFMPSLSANPADPTSLKCAACGCHRNFHRRIIALRPRDDALEGEGEREGQDDEAEDEDEDEPDDADDDSRPKSLSPTPSPYFSSAPHMLLALSSGLRDGDSPSDQRKGFAIQAPVASVTPLRKRFRTKFSSEQKERMLELSERLGWRLQKRDEELVEKCCGEIGVGKGVFKVWMHNNKHQLFGQSGGAAARRGEAVVAGVVSPSAAAGGDLGGGGGGGGGGGVHKVDGNGNAMNGAC